MIINSKNINLKEISQLIGMNNGEIPDEPTEIRISGGTYKVSHFLHKLLFSSILQKSFYVAPTGSNTYLNTNNHIIKIIEFEPTDSNDGMLIERMVIKGDISVFLADNVGNILSQLNVDNVVPYTSRDGSVYLGMMFEKNKAGGFRIKNDTFKDNISATIIFEGYKIIKI